MAATAGPAPEAQASGQHSPARVSFQTAPDRYRHWRIAFDGPVATLTMDVAEDGGLRDGYELKLNSYDLGVDIELYDAVQRLRFEHPEVRAVVITSAKDKVFSAGANIRMLAASPHGWKVNFCKFTNETRNGIEDATALSGQAYLAALNGTASGGGYELALACEYIMLIDDRSAAVSLPELPLLGVLPGTGGLTRVTDKRHVRRDVADYFSTRPEGVSGAKAVAWRLVDEAVPRTAWSQTVAARAAEFAARSSRPASAGGIALTPLNETRTNNAVSYGHVSARLDHAGGVAEITVCGPGQDPPPAAQGIRDRGAGFWPLAVARELDDLVLDLRTNEPGLGTWILRTAGDPARVLAYDRMLLGSRDDWLVNEIILYLKRTLRRLDVTSRSLIALIEPGSCFAGSLLELALAADRSYMLAGVFEDADPDTASWRGAAPPGLRSEEQATREGGASEAPRRRAEDRVPAVIAVAEMNLGALPMGNDLTRLQTRFFGDPDALAAAEKLAGQLLEAGDAERLGLVTFA
ncbi:MAG TPA: enoyl-CoA hydratase-related protein, partial [Streptosporangiaceae bacterium]|nr:enoyl-CoA hydratase-related protein [Streptosporangiaceae bacterium]